MGSSTFYFLYPKAARRATKGIFIFTIAFATLGMIYNSIGEKNNIPTAISGTINKGIQIVKNGNSNNKVSIHLKEYPSKKFEFNEEAIQKESLDYFVATASIGEKVILEVNHFPINEDTKTIIKVLGLKYKGQTFLSPTGNEKNDNSLIWAIPIIVGIIVTIYMILEFSGVITKFQAWYNKQQTSIADYRRKPTINDFNEIEMEKPPGSR